MVLGIPKQPPVSDNRPELNFVLSHYIAKPSARRSTNARGAFTVSGSRDNSQKVVCAHSSLRTSANISEKVGRATTTSWSSGHQGVPARVFGAPDR